MNFKTTLKTKTNLKMTLKGQNESENDPLLDFFCIFGSDDPKCDDKDLDGIKNEEDIDEEDPCIPNSFSPKCNDWDLDDVDNPVDPERTDPCVPDNSTKVCAAMQENENAFWAAVYHFVVDQNGHRDVRVPSVTAPPGAIVWVTDEFRTGSKFEVICRPEQVFGESFKPLSFSLLGSLKEIKIKSLSSIKLEAKFKGIGGNVDHAAEEGNSHILAIQNPRKLSVAEGRYTENIN